MRLVEELKELRANYYIITGDGTREFEILYLVFLLVLKRKLRN